MNKMLSSSVRRIIYTGLLVCAYSNSLFAQQPVAAFIANVTSGCSPLTVNFIDLSTDNPTSWSWDFGNGNGSVLQNPSAVYTNPGTYTVELKISNGNGSDSLTLVDFIVVFETPTANFTGDTANGCSLTIQLTDSSSQGSSPITSWYWDFGDGNISTNSNPVHTYSTSGTYYTSLTVTNTNGCTHTLLVNNFASVSEGPQANFASNPQTGCTIPFTANFSDSSDQGSFPIVSWLWDFSDMTPASVQNPAHTFTSFGSFDVTLIVTDSGNCSDSLTIVDYIIVNDFQADFSSIATVNCPNLQVAFSDSASPNPISWLWDFGDTNTDTVQNPVHIYDSSGIYPVTLIATNAIGCIDTMVKNITFEQPVASFTADSMDNCELPFPVNFINNSTGTGPLNYYWDFDDGSPIDTNANPSHIYTAEGIFSVNLIVEDLFGCTDTLSMPESGDSIIISKPKAEFNRYTLEFNGCIPLTVDFSNYSFAAVDSITNWSWNFGDNLSGVNNISSLKHPTHIYDSIGEYTVTLILTTARGCTDDTVRIDFVKTGIPPDTVYFTKAQDTACHGAQVQFTDFSTDTINNWRWSFGVINSQNPMGTFQDTGWQTITLQAGLNGCYDTSLVDSIYILPPKPDFLAAPRVLCFFPQTVAFVDASLEADSWQWDFGDGSPIDNSQNPTHTYLNPGYYPVQLTVSNSNGCIDSLIEDDFIRVPGLQSDFSTNDTLGCFAVDVSITESSSSFSNIVSWIWDFGDGNTDSIQSPPVHTYSDTGKYDITLITRDQFNCRDTLIQQEYITVNGIFPDFEADTLKGCTPLVVNFADSSDATSPGVSWIWDFGDNSPVGTSQNPTHTYVDTGVFDVQLIVVDSDGCTDTVQKNNYIGPSFPYPGFNYSVNACPGENINIANTSSGIGLKYFWDFGDGSTDSILNPMYSYSATGNFTITLTVTDTNGCDSSLSQTITAIPFPVADFAVDTLITNCPPLVVTFGDLSTAIGDSITSWFWDFGDGGTATAQNPVHTFLYPDTFDVSLVIVNSTGCSDTIVYPDLIFVGGPYGAFTFSPDSGCAPLQVTFNASAANTVNYQWDYGDGVIDTSIADSTVHIYTQPENPNPSLLLIDSSGCVQQASAPPISIIVDQPVVFFQPSHLLVCGFDTVTFLDYSYTLNPNTTIISRIWDFGDGDTSILVNPTHFYTDSGIHVVTLTIVTSAGCTLSKTDTIHITVNDSSDILTGLFMDTSNVICFGDDNATATISLTGGTPSYTYFWDDSSNQTTATASGLLPGLYHVIVTDSNGCTMTDSTLIGEWPEMIIAISNAVNSTCKNDNNGEATVSVTSGLPPYTYLWDDSSGQTGSTAVNLIAGTYTVTVTDTVGCDTNISVTIALDSIITIVISAPDTICTGITSLVSATVTGGDGNYAYLWSDGSTNDSVIINIDTTTTYLLTVKDSCAQQEEDSVTIAVHPYALIGITPIIDSGCGQVTVSFLDT
ncbi:MAG: PKD domain-containing protein, partial [Flavobacteriales bacterium]|nr:PKD domain-containing protein [Flavobacteriales bacterium]